MPTRLDKGLFIAGLLTFAIGQLVIALVDFSVTKLEPIDYAHWLLILAVTLMIPFAARLPRKGVDLIASPVLILGIIGIIGMCMIDFVFWALPPGQVEYEVTQHLVAEPSVWKVFMRYGPGEVFVTGLTLPALTYIRRAPLGAGLVVASAIINLFLPQAANPALFSAMAIGYWMCFGLWRREGSLSS